MAFVDQDPNGHRIVVAIDRPSPHHSAAHGPALVWLMLAFVLFAQSAQALSLTGVQSRKAHPAGGANLDLRIDTAPGTSGAVTIEPRASGAGHTVVFQFDGPITSAGSLSVIEDGLALLGGASAAPAGSEVVVSLPAIADNKRITVTLTNVNGVGLNASASLGLLAGDVNGSRAIDGADVLAAKARAGQSANAASSPFDVNASGTVTAADIAAIKARSGRTLAAPPILVGATIGAAGGVISGPDGVQVVVPPDAVSEPVTFRVDRGDAGAPALTGLNALTPVYAVTPHGQLFEGGSVISIPFSAAQIPAGATPILLKAELGGTWRVMRNVSTDPMRMAADIDGLSFFVIGTCSAVPTDEWTIGGVGCPSNHELRLTLLDGDTPVQVLRGPNGVPLPLWNVVDTPQTRDFLVEWTRPASSRVDQVSVLGSRGGFAPNPRDVNATFSNRFSVTIDPAQIPGAGSANGALLRVTAIADYTTTATRIGTGSVPVGFRFETDIPIRVRYSGALPVIATQPANVGVIAGQSATFTVAASGSGLTSQWSRRANASAAFADIVGATASSYTLAVAQLTDHGAQFQVRVCASPTACIPSNPATLSVIATGVAPTFTTLPADRSVVAGQTASFTVVATGQPVPQVKWQVAPAGSTSFADISGVAACAPTSPAAGTSVAAGCTIAAALGDDGKR
ncbi:MAG TPA: dockerin type I domain-containing protein, partial [Vicinamibacterales bacterium]|nr:dockerin type I domain-containing protein [Vicinamibacterales bacterium]